MFKERFPNCELFWKHFIVPMTKRVEVPLGAPGFIDRRGVADDLWNISYVHYSFFLHLTYAFGHLSLPLQSSLVNFYTHLGSACDLAEDFLLSFYLLFLECRQKESPVLQQMSKDEFLAIASNWYDKSYSKVYDDYHSKGKAKTIGLPSKKNILAEYVGTLDAWTSYDKFVRSVREYRNILVHSVQIGQVHVLGGSTLIPKRQKIQQYKTLSAVLSAAQDPKMLKEEFILAHEQMCVDFAEFQSKLNAVWERPLTDTRQLFAEANSILLEKYHLHFVP